MKFVARYDVEVPITAVWAELTDFDQWERMAIRRGAEVIRTDRVAQKGAGMIWAVAIPLRGQLRKATITLPEFAEPERLGITVQSTLADAQIVISLIDMNPSRTRLEVRTELKPRTIAARLYVQGLKLARKKVERQYSNRIGQLAVEIEERHRRGTSPKR